MAARGRTRNETVPRVLALALLVVPACAAGTVLDDSDGGSGGPGADGGSPEPGTDAGKGGRDSGKKKVGQDGGGGGDTSSPDDDSGGSDASGECVIKGKTYADGAGNPANPCQVCKAAKSSTSWSARADGTSCGSDEVCSGGTCGSGCFISGTSYASGEANPSDACQTCVPATSTTSWSTAADGTGCGSGAVCSAGSCDPGCYIGGQFYASASVNPGNSCQTCQPATSTTAWSNLPDESACTYGACCSGGCVDETSNASHCGSCGTVCPGTSNGTAECSSRACAVVCDPGFTNEGGVCVSTPCSVTFPATVSSVGGPDSPGTLGSGGGGIRYQDGDYVAQEFSCATPSITELTVDFDMSDRTIKGYCVSQVLTWDMYVNGTLIGSYSWNAGSGPATVTTSGTVTASSPILAVGGTYTIEYIATTTVCYDGGAWNWIAGGSATLQ